MAELENTKQYQDYEKKMQQLQEYQKQLEFQKTYRSMREKAATGWTSPRLWWDRFITGFRIESARQAVESLQRETAQLRSEMQLSESEIVYKKQDASHIRSDALKAERQRLVRERQERQRKLEESAASRTPWGKVFHWFRKRSYENSEAEYLASLRRLDRDIDFQLKNEKKLAEREKKIEIPDVIEDEGANKGDLEYHKATGRGLETKNHSQIFEKRDTTVEAGTMKADVLNRVRTNLDRQKTELEQKQAVNNAELESMADINHQTKVQAEDMVHVSEHLKKIDDVLEARKEFEKLEQSRLKEIAKAKKSSRKEIESNLKKQEKDRKKIADKEAELAPFYQKREDMNNELRYLQERLDSGESLNLTEARHWYRLHKNIPKVEEKIQKQESKLLSLKISQQKHEDLVRISLEKIEELEKEVRDIADKRADREAVMEAHREAKEILKEQDTQNREQYTNMDEISATMKESQKLAEKLDANAKNRQNAEKDVAEAEVSSFLVNNEINDTVEGVIVQGQVYLDHQEMAEKEIQITDNDEEHLHQQEVLRQKEMKKIADAIRNRPLFQFLNSETISDYMLYNEKTGEFDLADENMTPEQRAQFEERARRKYFKDDTAFTNHKIEQNPETEKWKAIGQIVGNSMKAVWNELWPEGATAIGADYMVPAFTESEALKVVTPEHKVGAGIGAGVRADMGTQGVMEAADLAVTIMDGPVESGQLFKNTMFAKEATQNWFGEKLQGAGLLKDGGYKLTEVGAVAYALDYIQFVHRISSAQYHSVQQKREMENKLAQGYQRFARQMKSCLNETNVERMKAIVSMVGSTARTMFMAGTGITGLVTDLTAIVGKIIVKAVATGKMRGKNINEILNMPEVLGGIDYNKKLVSEEDFQNVLANVTGIGSKEKLVEAMQIVDSIDLHRVALKSQNRMNLEVDKQMAALGYGDKSRYDKVTVADIVKKTKGSGKDWRTELRNAVETEGVDYDTSGTIIDKANHNLVMHAKNMRKSSDEITYQKQKKLVEEKLGSQKDGRGMTVEEKLSRQEAGKKLYESFIHKLESESRDTDMNLKVKQFRSEHARIQLIPLLGQTKAADFILGHPDVMQNGQRMTELAVQAVADAGRIEALKNGTVDKEPQKEHQVQAEQKNPEKKEEAEAVLA